MAGEPSLHDAAVQYAGAGIPVFPLRPQGKQPYPYSRGFRDATTDIDDVDKFWTTHPDANIGARCGIAFDVLDIDVKVTSDGTIRKDGRPALHQLNHHGLLAGWIGIATTRHAGTHLFFPPSGLRKGSIPGQHVDFQAAESYVVMPPSIVPVDDDVTGPGCYQWTQPLDLDRATARPFDWDAARQLLHPEPTGLAAMFSPPRSHTRTGEASIKALADFVTRLHPDSGNRNLAFFWACMRAVEDGLNPGDLEDAALSTGLTKSEIERTIESARTRGVRKESA